MPIQIIRNDITKLNCDAIVNAANSSLLGGGGVDGAIHRAAGPELLEACRKLGGCPTGEARITKGYRLPGKYVIHTVGPVWQGGGRGERELLVSCYRESLRLALEYQCETVAFPLISSGVYGYPKDQALKVAVDTIGEFLLEHELFVYLVIFDRASYTIGEKLFADIRSYIDDRYVELHGDTGRSRSPWEETSSLPPLSSAPFLEEPVVPGEFEEASFDRREPLPAACPAKSSPDAAGKERTAFGKSGLDDALAQIDESFSQMLLRKIDEKGMTDAQCYKRANMDRKLFSKIRGNVWYKPKKQTAVAFAIALELSLEETKELLMKAGFALSHSSKFDIIIEYFIENGNYNVFEINEALFAFDQSLLGA